MSSAPTKPKRRFNTIGLRLTLWGTAVTLLVCSLMCVTLYLAVFYSLRGEVDAFLEGEVHEFLAILRHRSDDFSAVEQAVRLELGSRSREDLFFRLVDSDGVVQVSSRTKDQSPIDWRLPPDWGKNTSAIRFDTIRPPGSRFPFRICSKPVRLSDGRLSAAQAGYLLDRLTSSLDQFRRICLIALALVAVIAVVGGRFLASRSLLPIATMTSTARQIGVKRLNDRLPRTGNSDELDALAATLNEMLDRIEQYVTGLQRFTADASHELRTPLAALRGSAEVALSRSRTPEELRAVVEESIDHYDRLSRIADSLLFLARVDAGAAVLAREQIRLDKAVTDVIDLYAPLAGESHIDVACAPTEPLWINADAGRIRQLFGNVLDNAIKYINPPGKVEVTLSKANGSAVVKVRDTGVGIPAEAIDRVFDRFFRVDQSRAAGRQHGAGLGLPICRSIAEAHGGRIELFSQPGQGTIVTVTLPLDHNE